MHKPKFHPEVLSHRSADLLSVSAFRGSDACPVRGLLLGVPSTLGLQAFGLGTRDPAVSVWEPWASSLGLLLVLAELAQPLCSRGMGRTQCPPCTPAARWWALAAPAFCQLLQLCFQLQHTIPAALSLGTYSKGMYFSALLLHRLQLTADLCPQVLSHKHSAAAGVLGGNRIALSDISVPAQWLLAKQAAVPRKQ